MADFDMDSEITTRFEDLNTFVQTHMDAAAAFLETLQAIDSIRPPEYVPNDQQFPTQGMTEFVPTFTNASVDKLTPITYTPSPLAFNEATDIDLSQADKDKPLSSSYHASIDAIMTDVNAAATAIDQDKPSEDEDAAVQAELDANLPSGVATAIGTVAIDNPSVTDFTSRYDQRQDAYASTLLDKIKRKVATDLQSGTGLSPSVDTALWQRDEARMNAARDISLNRISDQLTTWGVPAFLIQDAQNEVMVRHNMDMTSRGYDRTAKTAELEQKNIGKSVATGLQLTSVQIEHYNRVRDRALSAAKAVVDVGLAVMDGQLRKLATLFEIGKTRVDAMIAVEKLKLERYVMAVQAFVKKIDAALGRIKGYSELYSVNAQIYRMALGKAEATANLKTLIDEAQLKHQEFNTQMGFKASDLNARNYMAVNEIRARVTEALGRLQISTNEQALQNSIKNRDLALRAAENNMRNFLEAVELHLKASEAGVEIHDKAIVAANDSITTVLQMASSESTILQQSVRATS